MRGTMERGIGRYVLRRRRKHEMMGTIVCLESTCVGWGQVTEFWRNRFFRKQHGGCGLTVAPSKVPTFYRFVTVWSPRLSFSCRDSKSANLVPLSYRRYGMTEGGG